MINARIPDGEIIETRKSQGFAHPSVDSRGPRLLMRSLERRVLRLHNIREAYASAHLLSNMQVLMLEHLGEIDAASRLMKAIEDVCAAGMIMPDVGGKATTREVTDAVIAAIRGSNTSPIGNTASNRL